MKTIAICDYRKKFPLRRVSDVPVLRFTVSTEGLKTQFFNSQLLWIETHIIVASWFSWCLCLVAWCFVCDCQIFLIFCWHSCFSKTNMGLLYVQLFLCLWHICLPADASHLNVPGANLSLRRVTSEPNAMNNTVGMHTHMRDHLLPI